MASVLAQKQANSLRYAPFENPSAFAHNRRA